MQTRRSCLWMALACLLMANACPAAAQTPTRPVTAQAANAPPFPPAQAQQALDVLRDDKRRAELITTLEAIAKAAPGGPQAGAGSAATPDKAAESPLVPNSLGAQFVAQASAAMSEAGAQLVASLQAVNDLPLLWRWVSGQAEDPAARARAAEAAWKLLVTLGTALAAELGVRLVLRRVRAAVSRGAHSEPTPAAPADSPEPSIESGLAAAEAGETEHSARQRRLTRALSALRRLPFLFGRLLLDTAPVAVFAVVGYMLIGTSLGAPPVTRLVIIAVLQAYVAARLVLILSALLISPVDVRLRLLHISDWAAAFLTRWVRRITITGLFGYAMAEVGLLFGMYRTAYEALLKLFSLVVHVCLVIVVLQARAAVSRRIRAPAGRAGVWAAVRNRLADIWHLIAIFYITALWLVWAVELRNGYVRLLHFFVATAAVMIGGRLAAVVLLGGLDRLRIGPKITARHPGLESRMTAYYPILRAVLMGVIGVAMSLTLLEVWGFSVIGWFQDTGLGGRALSAFTLIGVTVVLAVVIWEGVNAAIDLHLARLTEQAQLARAGRLRTLLPMLRTVLLVTILLIVVLMSLSDLGVNIAPLLAGAGVVGIAVGFGSQKLVQDLITGLFLLLENAMQVGDVVILGGLSGTVEALSIRAIRLRAIDGSVHIIPFSAVTTVTNQTRDYSYAVLDVSVGLNEDPEHIAVVLNQVGDEMRADAKWTDILLEPLDVMGVDKFVDTAWVMRARMKTLPASRWAVGRELNRRIKTRFDELAIESPFTSYRVLQTNPAPPTPILPQEALA